MVDLEVFQAMFTGRTTRPKITPATSPARIRTHVLYLPEPSGRSRHCAQGKARDQERPNHGCRQKQRLFDLDARVVDAACGGAGLFAEAKVIGDHGQKQAQQIARHGAVHEDQHPGRTGCNECRQGADAALRQIQGFGQFRFIQRHESHRPRSPVQQDGNRRAQAEQTISWPSVSLPAIPMPQAGQS